LLRGRGGRVQSKQRYPGSHNKAERGRPE